MSPATPPPAPLKTEQPHPDHPALDRYTTAALVDALAADQAGAAAAVRAAGAALARAVDAAAPRLAEGGRLVYVGAGTSGRLGLLDSVELNPTFSWPPERALALLAGGPQALHRAVEGAEDSRDLGAGDIAAAGVGANDVVLVLAASGSTPYAVAAAEAARAAGALTVGFANNPGAPLLAACEVGVLLDTGAEVIGGSTRLKAGTAQKIALNTFSSAVMVKLHKVYGNLMVDVRASGTKLLGRAAHIVADAAGVEAPAAADALLRCGGEVKTAIVWLRRGGSPEAARAMLLACGGALRAALEAP